MQPIDPILNPTVFLWGYEWREPMTTLTDFLVALVCWYAFYRLQTYPRKKPANFRFYKLYFLCFAIGMTSAAWFGHGLQAYVGPRMKIIGWLMSTTGMLMLSYASLKEVQKFIPKNTFLGLRTWMIVQYILFCFLMIHPRYSDFILPQINSTLALLFFILPLQIYNYWQTKSKGGQLIIGALIYGIVPGLVYNTQFSIHRWYNYHDISHTLVAIFMAIMFIGISKIIQEKSSENPQASSKSNSTTNSSASSINPHDVAH